MERLAADPAGIAVLNDYSTPLHREAALPIPLARGRRARRPLDGQGSHAPTREMSAAEFMDFAELVTARLAAHHTVGILGATGVARRLIEVVRRHALAERLSGIYSLEPTRQSHLRGVPIRPLDALRDVPLDTIVVAADEEKEEFLWRALPFINGCPHIILGGYRHFSFRDPLFERVRDDLEVPSLANGYPNSLIHLYQCLQQAAKLDLNGIVAELGMFRGGTTMFLARIIEELGRQWPIIGFDTFDGFPAPRSPLDMYTHDDLCKNDLGAVKTYLSGKRVEIVPGDIRATSARLRHENLVLTFFDTDNFSPAQAALEIVREQTVVGGTILFDHFTGVDRFKHTLGERMAARALTEDERYFNLHGTGVFVRLQ